MQSGHNFPKKNFSEIAEELSCSVLPLIFCILAIIFKAYSRDVVDFLIVSLLIGSALLFIRRAGQDWKDGKLAGLAIVIGFLGWYAVPAFINLLAEGVPYREILPVPIDAETTIWGLIYLSSFMVVWILASNFFDRVRFFPAMFSSSCTDTDPKILICVAIVCCMAGLIPYIFSGLGFSEVVSLIFQGRIVEKPWLHWENLGNYRSAFLYMGHSAMAAGTCVLWIITRERRFSPYKRIAIGLLALIITSLIFFDQGTRSTIAMIMLPLILMTFSDTWEYSRFRFLIITVILGGIFFFFLQLQLHFRGSGAIEGIPKLSLYKWFTLEDTTDLFSETVFSLKLVPVLHDYFRESVLVQFLVSPIPRFLWPSKPASDVVWFYTLQRWGIDVFEGGGNVFPGIVGQAYMSWGVWGPILLGGFMGWLSSRVDRYLFQMSYRKHHYFGAVGIMMSVWILLSFRVLSPGLLYIVAMVFVLVRLSSIRREGVFIR